MRGIIFAGLLASLGAGTAHGAIVYLKEGGRLEGALVSATDAEVVLDTSQGRVRIDMNRVQNIDNTQGGSPPPVPGPIQGGDRAPADETNFDPRRQMLSFDVGLAAPVNGVVLSGTAGGGSANNGDVGPAFGLQYLYLASRRVGWGLDFHYYQRGEAASPSLLPSADAHVFGDTLLLLGVVKYSLADRGFVRPFVLLGAGAHRTTTTIDAHPSAGFAWSDTQTGETRRLVDGSAVGLAASVRLGLDFGFADPRLFSLEAGWTGLTSAHYGATPQGQALGITGVTGPLNYITFTGRWGFSF
jgi:hypothetical protein